MREGPDVARVAALIGDPARAAILTALMDGRALTAGELAIEAGVTKQTASAHLARLLEGDLLARQAQGRHRYFRLKSQAVADALEALMCLAQTGPGRRVRPGPKDPALRRARVCYDHLAGEMAVAMCDGLSASGALESGPRGLVVSEHGWRRLALIGLRPDALPRSRRPQCRLCLDWSMRRNHLAGAVGAALLERFFALGWARREQASRVVVFSPSGERDFLGWLREERPEP